jgi:ethanolamine utilization microcompartment shell protein EutS
VAAVLHHGRGMTSPHRRGTDISGSLLGDVHDAYLQWLGDDYDLGALNVVLCAAAAEKLSGDPPWVLVVGGSGAAKTETVAPLTGAGAVCISTITGEAALLSGTPAKSRAKHATGGLLRKIGGSGLLVVKDFTSILSMNRDTRALVLAALREIYDGHWSRNVGTDGGFTLTWHGRLVVIGAVTTAWDAAHQVVSTMGDRFVLVRLRTGDHRRAAGLQAMGNVSHETRMRQQLSDMTGKLLAGAAAFVDSEPEPGLTEPEMNALLGLADLVTRARTPVERDYQGNPAFAHALEMPTRFAKQLVQIVRGGLLLGLDRETAMRVAVRCCQDTMPPLRRVVLADVAANPDSFLPDVVDRVQIPKTTADRALQELQLLGLLTVQHITYGDKIRWPYSLAPGIDRGDLSQLTQKCQ